MLCSPLAHLPPSCSTALGFYAIETHTRRHTHTHTHTHTVLTGRTQCEQELLSGDIGMFQISTHGSVCSWNARDTHMCTCNTLDTHMCTCNTLDTHMCTCNTLDTHMCTCNTLTCVHVIHSTSFQRRFVVFQTRNSMYRKLFMRFKIALTTKKKPDSDGYATCFFLFFAFLFFSFLFFSFLFFSFLFFSLTCSAAIKVTFFLSV